MMALVGLISACLCANGLGQLTVLSPDNSASDWKQAQIAAIEEQLLADGLQADLKSELEGQRAWLKQWEPGGLNEQPIWSEDGQISLRKEPIVDPRGLADALRGRLLGEGARPTDSDTEALKALLRQHRDDIGVRQLHLHWLDQLSFRKDYADDIAEAAGQFATLLETQLPDSEERKWAVAFALYRRGRALAYRELPDVIEQSPIEDPENHDAQLRETFARLVELVGPGRPEFVLLEVRMLRRDQWFGRALCLLERQGSTIQNKWLLKKRRDLLEELHWEAPHAEAAQIYQLRYPEEAKKEAKAG